MVICSNSTGRSVCFFGCQIADKKYNEFQSSFVDGRIRLTSRAKLIAIQVDET